MTKYFPHYYQPDAMDCGATCLRMIAKYYGKEYSIETLREKCFTAKDGVSLLSVSKTAEELGFKTIGGRVTYQKLTTEAPLPCMLYWNQEHFVVLYKIEKSKLYKGNIKLHIADPGKGLLSYSEEEFKKNWVSTQSIGEEKGVVLLFEPTSDFYSKEGEIVKTKSIKFILKYFLRYKKYFTQLILSLIFASLLQLIFPFLTQSIVDIGISSKNISFIYLILMAQMTLILSRMLVDLIRRWILLHISVRVNLSLISDFFIKLMKLPMKFFDTKLTGDILQRIEDHSRVENFITSRSLETIFSVFTLLMFSVVLFTYSIKIFIIFLIGSILYTSWILIFLKKRRELDFKFFEQRAKSQSSTYQLINGMQEIKLQNYETVKRWEWEDIQADLFQLNIASLKLDQTRSIGNTFIEESKNVLITIVAATAVINGEMTLGIMLATQYIIGQLSVPIDQLVNLIHDFQDTKISLERINEIHQKEDENTEKTTIPKHLNSNDIVIKGLLFQYEGPFSKKVLNNIDLIIPTGKVTAIVGASGSGKTTLIKLLLQYYAPIEGEVLIADYNLQNFNSTEWRNRCGAVMQDGFIFSETIAQNIAMARLDDIDKEKLNKAAQIANIHDFIMSMPLKYNTVIGGEGQNLSQGQKQRLLIARAVYKNPDFLFFDEATNALDANNEKAIVENLQDFYKGKTVIIVAHRLSTVKNADQIVVFDDGRIVEIGSHKELTVKRGAYFELVKNQLELGN